MRGVVTTRDVLANLRTVWVEFGPRVTFSCIGAIITRRPTTFLDMALKDVVMSPRHAGVARPHLRLPRA